MKKCFLFYFVLLISNSLTAQVAIKIYQNLDLVNNYTADGDNEPNGRTYNANFARTSLAVQFSKRTDIFHEIEFSYAKEAIPIVHIIYSDTEYIHLEENYGAMQYEFNKILIGNSKFKFSFGTGVLLYYFLSKEEPRIQIYPREQRYLGGIVNATPRIQYNISKRLLADVNFKWAIFDLRHSEKIIHNPMLPFTEQFEKSTETYFFPETFNVRLGLGYRL